ncbi:hypothetical protein HDV00_008890 [Rhizophlyctis rosea]|nr:hypothetical protein HDV00_008890 [Rhizophlyctis rosea]
MQLLKTIIALPLLAASVLAQENYANLTSALCVANATYLNTFGYFGTQATIGNTISVPSTFAPGETLDVIVNSPTPGFAYRGLLVYAATDIFAPKHLGEWIVDSANFTTLDSGADTANFPDCSSFGLKATLSHTTRSAAYPAKLKWTPPADLNEPFQFFAVTVQRLNATSRTQVFEIVQSALIKPAAVACAVPATVTETATVSVPVTVPVTLPAQTVTATVTVIAQPTQPVNCAPRWAQCGGVGYTGPTCCQAGKCTAYGNYYSQCA